MIMILYISAFSTLIFPEIHFCFEGKRRHGFVLIFRINQHAVCWRKMGFPGHRFFLFSWSWSLTGEFFVFLIILAPTPGNILYNVERHKYTVKKGNALFFLEIRRKHLCIHLFFVTLPDKTKNSDETNNLGYRWNGLYR